MTAALTTVCIGIIGGTGFEKPDVLQNAEERIVETPFGKPSDALKIGFISGVKCIILPRHGRKHDIMPSRVNYRANIWALKKLGCTHIIVTTACGSLREQIVPGDLVVPDQFIDRTTKRETTFYDNTTGGPKGICHIPMNPVFCESTRQILLESIKQLRYKYHEKGTIVVVEGPRFSTKAESNLYRSWGADLVGMTMVPEAILAKEMSVCYAALALPTDYDCWRDDCHHEVNVESVMKTFAENIHKAIEVLKIAVKKVSEKDWTKDIAEHEDTLRKALML